MRTLYIFIDESGNFDFTSKGTSHFVLSAVTALDPLVSSLSLQSLKYRLMSEQIDVECFHASPDSQTIRNRVFAEIGKLSSIRINYIYADKHKTHPSYQTPESMYALFGKTLLNYVFNGWLATQYEQVIVIFDKALTSKQQKAFLRVVKPALKATAKPYQIFFHKTMADFNGQIADYCAWAKYVSLEKGEQRPLQSIQTIPTTSFDIFRSGRTRYY
jgi:hypothetical protein